MVKAVALFAVLCGCLFIYGFLTADRVRISVHKAKRVTDLDVMVTVPNVTTEMHTVRLESCAAGMRDDAVMFCLDDGWWIGSSHPMQTNQPQYEFPLRNVPRGLLMFAAAVMDIDGNILAAGETRTIR